MFVSYSSLFPQSLFHLTEVGFVLLFIVTSLNMYHSALDL